MTARAMAGAWLCVALILGGGLYVGYRTGEKVAYYKTESLAEANAVDIASMASNMAALTDRLIALTEAVTFTGWASFYAYPFHGRQTASLEIFDKDALTAASRWLPLKTWWIVSRVDDGRSVRVFVNDRGPYVGNRIIDLSEGAARVIGMLDAGLVRVRVQPEGR